MPKKQKWPEEEEEEEEPTPLLDLAAARLVKNSIGATVRLRSTSLNK